MVLIDIVIFLTMLENIRDAVLDFLHFIHRVPDTVWMKSVQTFHPFDTHYVNWWKLNYGWEFL